MTPHRPNKESHPLPLGKTPIQSIRNHEDTHVPKTNPIIATLQSALLPSNRRFGVRRGSRTLTGGRT